MNTKIKYYRIQLSMLYQNVGTLWNYVQIKAATVTGEQIKIMIAY